MAAELLRTPEVDADRLRVADVQAAVAPAESASRWPPCWPDPKLRPISRMKRAAALHAAVGRGRTYIGQFSHMAELQATSTHPGSQRRAPRRRIGRKTADFPGAPARGVKDLRPLRAVPELVSRARRRRAAPGGRRSRPRPAKDAHRWRLLNRASAAADSPLTNYTSAGCRLAGILARPSFFTVPHSSGSS